MAESRDITAEDARTAAQIEADVGVEHIANVYAKALLDATEQAGQTAAVLEEFDAVMAEVLDRFPKLEAVLGSMLVSPEEKSALIDGVLGGRVSATLVNFLKVVARHGRLDCLRAIHRQTHALYDKLRNRIPVRLTTARPSARRRPSASPKACAPNSAASRSSSRRPTRADRRRRAPHRRHRLRRLDRQPIAEPPSTDYRQDRP